MNIVAKTDVGQMRKVNQDRAAYAVNGDEWLAIVCDGMGGHRAGEVASTMACDYLTSHIFDHGDFVNEESVKSWLHCLIENTNQAIKRESILNPDFEGMGTTIVLAYCINDEVHISHCGDSRAYAVEDNCIRQLTVDDTLVNALVENGYLSYEAAQYHPQRNVLVQAVGVTSPLKVSHMVTKEKHLLLCSDGLYNSLTDEDIFKVINQDMTTVEKVDELIRLSNEAGGYDNTGIVLVEEEN
ncbi:MAG: Stp1/IreP family PP2C-type Ser/Thr phosphatase [Erysipelotrichaceae bacterium]|nr:Stp1/IreP family PP2C-type Ser/Thr phosphatase [Erysipelotrichaceae bacterium]